MLEFFRHYQKFFFFVITIVIVISFSFFGTYNAFVKSDRKDGIAFKAIDGSNISQAEYYDFTRFLNADMLDSFFKGVPGGSFNDGFIAQDILDKGVFLSIAAPFMKEISSDLEVKFDREKRYQLYSNPNVPFLSVEQVWTYYAPSIKDTFHALQTMPTIASKEAMDTRVKLYLQERQFPEPYLKNILRYQESQYPWVTPDKDLPYKDLWLFGYHSFQDWFGKRSLDLIAEYVINVAKIAEKKGFTISRQRIHQHISNIVRKSYVEQKKNPRFTCPNEEVFFEQELQAIGMDNARLENIVRYILLYRDYMQSFHEACVVSPEPFKEFHEFLNENVTVDAYRIPNKLCFNNIEDLEKFELYVQAVGDHRELLAKGKQLLLPAKVLAVGDARKTYPELVGKHYRVRYTHVNKEEISSKIGVKRTWEWQVEDANWKRLQEKFSELKKGKTETVDRAALLHALDAKTRATVDQYSRKLMVEDHPEWVEAAFKQNKPEEVELFLRDRGGKMPFRGIQNPIEFMRLLDLVPLDVENPALRAYSQDMVNYYSIIVLDRKDARILTFKEALQDGTLDELMKKTLEATYLRIRATKPTVYQKPNGDYKPLEEVLAAVGEAYFSDFFSALDTVVAEVKKKDPSYTDFSNGDEARIACRFYPQVKSIRDKIASNPKEASKYTIEVENEETSNDLVQQFMLVHSKEKVSRRNGSHVIDVKEAFIVPMNSFSKVSCADQNVVSFFQVLEKGKETATTHFRNKVYGAKDAIGDEIERAQAAKLMTEFMKKKAVRVVNE